MIHSPIWARVRTLTDKQQRGPPMKPKHYVSQTCIGEVCSFRPDVVSRCNRQATHKIGEEIATDDPNPIRHNATSYLCCEHYCKSLGYPRICQTVDEREGMASEMPDWVPTTPELREALRVYFTPPTHAFDAAAYAGLVTGAMTRRDRDDAAHMVIKALCAAVDQEKKRIAQEQAMQPATDELVLDDDASFAGILPAWPGDPG